MLFLLPLWPKESAARPVVTTGLVIANVLSFLIFMPGRPSARVSQSDLQRTARQLAGVLLAPDSGLAGPDRAMLESEPDDGSFPSPRVLELFGRVQADPGTLRPKARYEWDLVHPVFESYARAAPSGAAAGSDSSTRGFNPAERWWPDLITHQFLHAGWLHLILNLLFLWVAGGIVEASLGWHVLWVYLSGGVAAALAQVQAGIPAGAGMVGASGAIAALMGYGLVAHAREKVRLFYFVLLLVIPKYGVFDCPMWFFLPVWLVTQALMAVLARYDAAVHTAYAAHIGGFVFGALTGFAWRMKNTAAR